MTLQTMVVLMIGMAFGSRLGAATVLLYLVEGAFGLPVFSGTPERGIGLAYMAGPTGGYLAGFLAAAGLAGWLAERGLGRGVASTALCMLLGIVVIYGAGLLWLATLVGWDQRVLALGLFPFLGAELLKLSLASCLMPALWMLVRRRAAPRQGGDHE